MSISFEPDVGERSLSVRVSAAFLLEDALELDAAVAEAPPGTEVEVDFCQVREYQGPALARLAEVLRTGRAHLALHGMSRHEVRLLGYLGAPAASRREPPG